MSSSDNLRYVRRVIVNVKQDQVENFLSKVRGEIFPALRAQPGIRRMYLLRVPGTTEFMSATYWNDKTDADSYGNSKVFVGNIDSIRGFLESEPQVAEFDVEFHDVNAQDLPLPESAKEAVEKKRKSGSPSSNNSKKNKRSARRDGKSGSKKSKRRKG